MPLAPILLGEKIPLDRPHCVVIIDRQHPTHTKQDRPATFGGNARKRFELLTRDALLPVLHHSVNHNTDFLSAAKFRGHDWMIAPHFDAEQSSYAVCCAEPPILQSGKIVIQCLHTFAGGQAEPCHRIAPSGVPCCSDNTGISQNQSSTLYLSERRRSETRQHFAPGDSVKFDSFSRRNYERRAMPVVCVSPFCCPGGEPWRKSL